MAVVNVTVCDICQAEPAQPYTIETTGRIATVDLCAEHAQPLEDLLANGTSTEGSVPAGPIHHRTGEKYESMKASWEEIEARKRKRT